MNKRNILTVLVAAILMLPMAFSGALAGLQDAAPDYMATEFVWLPTADVPDYTATEFVWLPTADVPDYMATEFLWTPMQPKVIAGK